MATDRLVLRWGKVDRWDAPDWVYDHPACRTDARLLHNFLEGGILFDGLITELERRGYDTKTLRLTVRKRQGGNTDASK